MAILIRVLLFAAIVYAAYRILAPKYPIAITLDCDGVAKSKGLSKHSCRIIDEFARQYLLDGESVKVQGYFAEHGRVRWVFGKNVNPSIAQKFRNLIINE